MLKIVSNITYEVIVAVVYLSKYTIIANLSRKLTMGNNHSHSMRATLYLH